MSKIKKLSLEMDNGITVTTERKENNNSNSGSISIHFSSIPDVMVQHESASLEHLINFLFSSNF